MGDVLLSGPAVRAVAARASRVTYLCGPRGADAARLLPGVTEVLVRPAEWLDLRPEPVERASMERFVDQLASLEVDEAVVLTSFHQDPLPLALLLKMAGVPVVAATCRDYPGSLLDIRHHVSDDVHEVQRSLSLVARLGYRLPPGDDGQLRVLDVDWPKGLAPCPRAGFVAVHPGASVPARSWAPSNMRALVQSLVQAGHDVVVTGGSGEKALTSWVAGGPGTVVDLGGATGLAGLSAVLARAGVLVAGNTGPAHLAAAVGTPVVSLYAPTVPAVRWRPWGVPYALLGHQEIGCAGCRARACPVPGHPCIDRVPIAEVVRAVDKLLSARKDIEAAEATW